MQPIHRNLRAFLAACVFLLIASRGFAGPLRIDYELAPTPPTADKPARTRVQVDISGLRGETSVQLQMPVWSPGDYHVMNHAQYVQGLSARALDRGKEGADAALEVTKPDANTWEIQTRGADAIQVTYELPNEPPGFFSENVQVRERYAFYNGPATYLYVVGHKEDPVDLDVVAPAGWKPPIVPLAPRASGGKEGFAFAAPDYDTLADSPVVLGDYETRQFALEGRSHTVVFFNAYQGIDFDRYLPVIQKVVAEENRLMGGPPYRRYVFFFDVSGRGGGLEHLNSHRIAFFKGMRPGFLAGGVAHEFFHLWNVKRIRPAVLGPFDYIHPPRTRNLWFCEGITSYYGDLSVHRAGLATEEAYLQGLTNKINGLQSNPARLRVTADESSLRVWEAGNSSGYGGLSYYLKGELIGLCLDLKLRALTGGRTSLDDVMRDLMARYGLPKPGYPEDGIREAVIHAGGEEMGPFYDRLCRSTQELPFEECLAYAGLRLDQTATGRYLIVADPNATPEAVALRARWLSGR